MNENNILAAAAQNLLLVELKGVGGWSPNARIKDASRILAENYGGSEKAFKGSENLLPEPHDEEYKELKSAYGAVRSSFYINTMAYGSTVDAKSGKAKADGKRAVLASKIVDGEFMKTHSMLISALDEAREKFATALPERIEQIRNESALGSQFNTDRYPTPDDVRAGWFYEDIIPEPILAANAIKNMGLPPEVAKMIEDNLARKVEAQVQFGQQQLVEQTMEYIKTMVTNLTKLSTWFDRAEGKRPSIFDSLITNVTDSLSKLRTYALPGTDQGDAIITLAEGIESRLNLGDVSIKELKEDGSKAQAMLEGAKDAAKLIDAWSGTSTEFDAPAPKPEPTPTPKDEGVSAQDLGPNPSEELIETSLEEVLEETDTKPEPTPTPEVETVASDSDLDDLLAGW